MFRIAFRKNNVFFFLFAKTNLIFCYFSLNEVPLVGTEKGFFLDGQGRGYMQQGGKFYDAGEYNPDVHGLPVPLVKKQKKRSTLQIA